MYFIGVVNFRNKEYLIPNDLRNGIVCALVPNIEIEGDPSDCPIIQCWPIIWTDLIMHKNLVFAWDDEIGDYNDMFCCNCKDITFCFKINSKYYDHLCKDHTPLGPLTGYTTEDFARPMILSNEFLENTLVAELTDHSVSNSMTVT